MQPDWDARIKAGEDAVSDGRAYPALAIADALLADGCTDADVFVIRGKALEMLKQSDAAIAAFDDGIALHPGSGRLRVDRGKALAALGRGAEAKAAFDAALDADPLQLEAVKGLLALDSVAPDDPRLKPVLELGQSGDASASKRAKAFYILGQIALEAGDLDGGFDHYRRANDIMADGRDPKSLEYRFPTAAFDLTRDVMARFARLAPAKPDCPALLVCGMPRSGKTIAETLLARNPDVLAGGELAILSRFAREFDWSKGGAAIAAALSVQSRSVLGERYVEAAMGRRFVTETSPTTIFRVGVMALLHPRVPVVLCQRDPLDLCAAIYFKQFRTGNLFSTKLETLGRAIARAERMAQHWMDHLPGPVLALSYEDTVRDPNGAADRLAALAGLPRPPRPDLPPPSTRLHPTRASDGALSPALIGFARPMAHQFAPALTAYAAERDRLAKARPR